MKSKLRGGVIGITTLMILFSAVAVIGVAHANIPEGPINLSDIGVICGYRAPHPLSGVCDGNPSGAGGATTAPHVLLALGAGGFTFTGTYYGVSDWDPTKEAPETQCVGGCPIAANGTYTNVVCGTGDAIGVTSIEGQAIHFMIVFVAGVGVVIPDPFDAVANGLPNSLTEDGQKEVMAVTGWPIQEIVAGVVLITKAIVDDAVIPPECVDHFDVLAVAMLIDKATPIEV